MTALTVSSKPLTNDGTLTGPRIIDDCGRDITGRGWSSSWTDATDLLMPLGMPPRRWRRDIPPDHMVYRRGGPVPYVQGACMAIGRERFAQLGGFDEEFFLFGEEEFLAQRLAREGRCHSRSSSTDHACRSYFTCQDWRICRRTVSCTRALWYRRDTNSAISASGGNGRCLPLASVLVFLLLTAPMRPRLRYRPIEDAAWCRAALRGLLHGLLRRPVTGPDRAQ